jgi:outer membrane protein assembly factor BamB
MKGLLFILALFSISFSSLIWEANLGESATTKALPLGNLILIGSSDGNVYALSPSDGSEVWKTGIGGSVNDLASFDTSAIASTFDGKVSRITTSGSKAWTIDLSTQEYNVSAIFGITPSNDGIYATTDRGIFEINRNGAGAENLYAHSGRMTPPEAGDGFVIFGAGEKLVKLRNTGSVEWERELDGTSFWNSRPAFSSTTVYVGALDNRLHSFRLQGGYHNWDFQTGNWVLSTPLVTGEAVFFGSNDGKVYALDPATGQMIWESITNLAVQSELISGFMGGRNVVFVASTDRNTYAMDKETGDILWEGSATDWAMTPLFHQNKVIFGSHDGSVYAFSTERACSIIEPGEGDVVGKKELVINGKYVSEAGSASVFVSLNNGLWQEAGVSDGAWSYNIIPEESLESGLNVISCKVVDAAGEESGERFTTTGISYDPTIPPSDLVVTLSPERVENEPFTVYVNDGDDGSPVNGFELSINGDTHIGNESLNLSLPAGNYQFEVEKVGFETYESNLSVRSTGVNPIVAGAGALIVLVLLYLIWKKLIEPYRKKVTRQ